jgi:hypothetical protein
MGGCVQGQSYQPVRAYSFTSGARSQDSMDLLTRSFLAEGHKPAVVDPETRVVHTAWAQSPRDNCPHLSKRAVQRYTAVLLPAAGEQVSVTVRLDQYCCEDGQKAAVVLQDVPAPHPAQPRAPRPSDFGFPEPELPAVPEVEAAVLEAEAAATERPEERPEARPAVPPFNPHKEDPTASEKCVRYDTINAQDQRTLDALGAALQQHLQRAVGTAVP